MTSRMLRLAVLASGRGSNLEALLAAAAAGLLDARIGLVITDRPGAPCLEVARAAGVPAVAELPPQRGETRRGYGGRLLKLLGSEAPDLVVLAGFMRVLDPLVVAAFPQRIVNLHPALLPAFPGAAGVRDALRAGARVAGCTTHFVTPEVDAGPIILQAAVRVDRDDTVHALAARIARLEHQILPRTVQLLAEGRVRVAPDGRVRILEGPSWRGRVEEVPDAVYPDGF